MSLGDDGRTGLLAADLRRLHAAVARWSPTRWAARTPDGRTRADVLFTLVSDLAVLADRAGCGAPSGLAPRRIGAHALPDQLVVVGGELIAAPGADQVVEEASRALAAARRLLLE
jgi:hypothetical protein